MPEFLRIDSISGKASLIKYSEDELTYEVGERPCPQDMVGLYPRDGVGGYKAIEIVLTNLLVKIDLEPKQIWETLGNHSESKNITEVLMETMFYLYFPEEAAANQAAELLSREGFDTEVRPSADDVNWLTLGCKEIEPRQLDETEMWMEELAQSLNGEYDGNEIKVR